MLKIIDVDHVHDYVLELVFSDGCVGTVDLQEMFLKPPLSQVEGFEHFSLTADGNLQWDHHQVRADFLRSLISDEGKAIEHRNSNLSMEEIIKQAAWDSMSEGRTDILQAAIRAYVEEFGHSTVIAKAGIKSRTSAYRSLKPDTTPNFRTLVQLGHAVIALAQEQKN